MSICTRLSESDRKLDSRRVLRKDKDMLEKERGFRKKNVCVCVCVCVYKE